MTSSFICRSPWTLIALGRALRGAERPAPDDEADALAGKTHVIEHRREIPGGLGEARAAPRS